MPSWYGKLASFSSGGVCARIPSNVCKYSLETHYLEDHWSPFYVCMGRVLRATLSIQMNGTMHIYRYILTFDWLPLRSSVSVDTPP